METLRNNIKVVEVIPLTVHDGDSNAALESDAVDMYQTANGPSFDSALITAMIGAVGGDVDVATVHVEEDDESDFSGSPTVCEGGAAQDVIAGDASFTFHVKRTKRYIRVVLTVEEDGSADDVEIAATAILNNWALPFPTV